MFHPKKQKKSKTGLPPGTIVYTGDKEEKEPIHLTLVKYDEKNFEKKELKNIEEFFQFRDNKKINWLIVQGIHNTKIIEELGEKINIHPIIMEDIANVFERIKIEVFDDILFILLKCFKYSTENLIRLSEKQISILLHEKTVIVFLEDKIEFLKPVLNRLQSNFGRIRKLESDYLFYSLIDVIIDKYFSILEIFGERIEDIEEELVENPTKDTLFKIQHVKRDMIHIRKIIFPMRETINSIIRGDSPLIKEETNIYFRDAYDHIIRVIETLESYRDMVSGLLDIYLSSVSNKMNEVMKVLTIIATIFIPLTFIAGVYGMNFLYMPEIAWKYSYLVVWIVMIIIAILMMIYFRKRKWI
jgi:magnesium transporter